jgi:NADP-dependent 3-hydroxy acid dehydrogenase YdfG
MSTRAVAIITGGSAGYGAGIAEVFRDDGIEVYITARDRAKLDDTASRLGVKAISADVTRADDWDRVFERVLAEAGRVDYLVNNAGGAIKVAPLADMADEDIIAAVNLNLTGVMLGSKRAARVMKEQGSGTIVNIGSVVSVEAWPEWTVYSAAKGGLHQFTKCLYAELRESGARATLIVPSWGQTDFAKAASLPTNSDKVRDLSTKPTEIGDLVLYCCRLPEHLWLQEAILWPRIQEVNPL